MLYVAVTRAKSRLILLGHARAAEDGPGLPHVHSLLRRLWVAVNDRFTEAWEHIQEAAGEVVGEGAFQDMGREARPAQVQVIRRLVSGWSRPQLPPRLTGWRVAGEDAQTEKTAETTEKGAEGEGIEFSWAGETARLVGTLTHRLLHRIAQQDSDITGARSMGEGELQVERVRRALAGLGVPREKIAEAAEKVLRAVNGIFAHEKGDTLPYSNKPVP